MSDKEKAVFIKMIRQELGIEDDVLLEPDLQVRVEYVVYVVRGVRGERGGEFKGSLMVLSYTVFGPKAPSTRSQPFASMPNIYEH